MALDTYDNLKTAIGTWMARSDLTSYYDDFIDLSETLFKRPPQPLTSQTLGGIRADKATATGTLSAVTEALPADYLELDSFRFTGDFLDPEYLSMDELGRRKRTGTGFPRFFSIGDTLEFDVTPDAAYSYAITYYPSFDALSGSQATNWVLTNYPDCYLSACLHYAHTFVMDEQRATFWSNKYKGAAHGANEAYRRGREHQGPVHTYSDRRTP